MILDRVMHPSSVAIIGASKNETKRGYQAIRTLMASKYEGNIYPVNPREDHILGFRCYKDVRDVDPPVDLALLATPAGMAPQILKTCGEKKVAGAVILAGGFREIGDRGCVLVRPDRTVAWRSTDGVDDPKEALRAVMSGILGVGGRA